MHRSELTTDLRRGHRSRTSKKLVDDRDLPITIKKSVRIFSPPTAWWTDSPKSSFSSNCTFSQQNGTYESGLNFVRHVQRWRKFTVVFPFQTVLALFSSGTLLSFFP
mmetsp:Transcript_11175/g.21632  ORF Transcript_11175/g.21632 Transcript_11175/m.21632 type:complete len:107 (+) Transcript_11175:277-597(+)